MSRFGFTLVETLVALAVFGIFLTGLLQVERTYRRALTEEDHALRVQQVQAAAELLRAELGRAGYASDGADLWIERGTRSDRVVVRYLDDRIAGEPTLKVIGYDAGRDSQGRSSLYRKEGTGHRQPAVLGAASLRVEGFLNGVGEWSEVAQDPVRAIQISLEWAWGERTPLTIGFTNRVTYGELVP